MTSLISILFCTSQCKQLTLAQMIECLSDLFCFIFLIIYTIILLRKRVFHANLLMILIALPGFPSVTSLLIKFLNKIILQSNGFNYGNAFTLMSYSISDTGLSVSSYTLMSLAIERLISTFYVDQYENICRGWPILSLFLITLQIALGISTVPLAYSAVISNYLSVGIIIVALSSAVLMFFVVNPLARRHYSKSAANFAGVSKRYQTTENLRIVRVLKLLIPYYCACEVLLLILFILMTTVLEKLELYWNLYMILIGAQVSGTMLIVLLRHPVLKAELYRFLPLREKDPPLKPGLVQIFNVDGLQLNYTTQQENDIYFRMLQTKFWTRESV
ncbi:unnamed protein product, partial [Mesorhabditis belari]|uniref:G protein-coupled receptor n=1 Tax=Mesorhabditis belari TaxID=2138241 RepID=A0AAF3FLP8_9BILA